MVEITSPVALLEEMAGIMARGADKDGLRVNPEQCDALANGLTACAEAFQTLLVTAAAAGLVKLSELPASAPRTTAERRRLAAEALAAATDPGVIRFPVPPHPATASQGGSAA